MGRNSNKLARNKRKKKNSQAIKLQLPKPKQIIEPSSWFLFCVFFFIFMKQFYFVGIFSYFFFFVTILFITYFHSVPCGGEVQDSIFYNIFFLSEIERNMHRVLRMFGNSETFFLLFYLISSAWSMKLFYSLHILRSITES